MRFPAHPALLGAGLLGAAVVLGQQQPAPPVFSREVELVKVDVVVTDKAGNPVTGLKAGDFTVFEEGKEQAVATFEAVHAPAEVGPASQATAPRARLATNVAPPGPPGRSFVIVFDNINMSPANAQRAKAAVAAFLEKGAHEGDRVTLVATGGGAWWSTRLEAGRVDLLAILKGLDGRRVHENAFDRISDFEAVRIYVLHDAMVARRVQNRLERYGARYRTQSTADREAQDRDTPGVVDLYVESRAADAYHRLRARNRVTFSVLQRALEPLAANRDRKAVLLVSEGFVHDPSEDAFKRVVEAARRANAAIYFVDTRGLSALPFLYDAQFGAPIEERDVMAAIADTTQEGEGAVSLAHDTGGFSVRNTNDLEGGITRIGRESRSYYLLGYSPGEIPRDGRFRRIDVKVRGKGLLVRARRGYYAPGGPATEAPPRPDQGDTELQLALDSPTFLDGVPLRMTAYVMQESRLGRARVLLAADIDVGEVEFQEVDGKRTATLDLLFVVAHRDSGEFLRYDQKVELERKPGPATGPKWYSVVREFDVSSGGHQAKLVVRDVAARRVGTVAYDFEVPPLDQFRVSTPILTDTVQQPPGQAGLLPVLLARRTFPQGATLYCRFDVFGAAKEQATGMPRVSAGHVLRRRDGTVRSRGEPTTILPTSLGAVSRLLQIPLDGIAPGEYELVLSVKDELSGREQQVREPFTVAHAATASGAGP